MNSVEIKSVDEWEKLREETAKKEELIVFKYSPICGVSSSVENDFNSWFSNLNENVKIVCAKVDVISAKSVSRYIAKELNIQHQSPQVIWLKKDGKVKWSGSHYDIDKSQLSAQLKIDV